MTARWTSRNVQGNGVLDDNTIGESNTGVGDDALGNNITGSYNTALGAYKKRTRILTPFKGLR